MRTVTIERKTITRPPLEVVVTHHDRLVRNGKPLPPRSPSLPKSPDVPVPPFLGSRTRTDFDMREVFGYLNELTLFSTQWQFRKGGVKPAEYERQIAEVARPALERLKKLCLDENILRPAATYGFFPAASDGNEAHRLRRRPHERRGRRSTSRGRTSAITSA